MTEVVVVPVANNVSLSKPTMQRVHWSLVSWAKKQRCKSCSAVDYFAFDTAFLPPRETLVADTALPCDADFALTTGFATAITLLGTNCGAVFCGAFVSGFAGVFATVFSAVLSAALTGAFATEAGFATGVKTTFLTDFAFFVATAATIAGAAFTALTFATGATFTGVATTGLAATGFVSATSFGFGTEATFAFAGAFAFAAAAFVFTTGTFAFGVEGM